MDVWQIRLDEDKFLLQWDTLRGSGRRDGKEKYIQNKELLQIFEIQALLLPITERGHVHYKLFQVFCFL